MIKLFIYEKPTILSEYFQEEDYNIPFLGSTLFDFVVDSYRRFAESIDQELSVYVPNGWELEGCINYSNIPNNLSEEDYELIFFTDLFTLPISDYSIEDYHFLKQYPDKLFSHKTGLKMGYLTRNSNIENSQLPESLIGFHNLLEINHSNFLDLNKNLVNRVKSLSEHISDYGESVILCDRNNINNSQICGPCFIGKEVVVYNSIIYPGTILTGRSFVKNSEIFESFICESRIEESFIKNSLVAISEVNGLSLNDSVLPRGGVLLGGRKR